MIIYLVDSPVDHIFNIVLKKRIFQKNVDVSLLSNFQTELAIAYEDLNDYSAIPNRPSFFLSMQVSLLRKMMILSNTNYMLEMLSQSIWKSLKIIMQLYGQYFVIKKIIIVLLS